jgi:antitoxin component of MazEF toxin-antitoxin module
MATEVTVRRWGNSLGVVLPKELIDKQNLSENETVCINVVKVAHLKDLFGSVKIKRSGQEFKDFVRKGWE